MGITTGSPRRIAWRLWSGRWSDAYLVLPPRHYSGAAALGNAQGYKYSHDSPDGVVPQQYPPDGLVGVDYYQPAGRGAERDIAARIERLRAIIRRKP